MKRLIASFLIPVILTSCNYSNDKNNTKDEHGQNSKKEHSHDTEVLPGHTENTVHQYAPTVGLLNSIYTGNQTPEEMVAKGNMGIGTVNDLDGELIAVDGVVYAIDAAGGITKAPKELESPNMTMINFQPKTTIEIKNIQSLKDLDKALKSQATSKNSFYAYRIKGTFPYLKMASAHKVEDEDVSLFEYLDTRVMYTRENIKGTLVGLYTPEYLGNVVIPGLHFHFLSDDIKLGGHLEGIKFDTMTVEVQEINQLNLSLPEVEKFRNKDLQMGAAPGATDDKNDSN